MVGWSISRWSVVGGPVVLRKPHVLGPLKQVFELSLYFNVYLHYTNTKVKVQTT